MIVEVCLKGMIGKNVLVRSRKDTGLHGLQRVLLSGKMRRSIKSETKGHGPRTLDKTDATVKTNVCFKAWNRT